MAIQIKNTEPIPTDDFWYDLFDGGYFEPENLCENPKDAEDIRLAMNTIIKYQQSLDDSGKIEWL